MADEKDELEYPDDIGFTEDELSSIVGGLLSDVEDFEISTEVSSIGVEQDQLPDIHEDDLLVSRGETWRLGRHKLVCGDCTEVEYLVKLLDEVTPDILWSVPPAGDIESVEIGTTGVRIAAEYLKKGASVFLRYKPTALDELAEMWVQPLRLSSEIIWVSDGPVEEDKYFRRNHESIWYGWKFGGLRKWLTGGSAATVYNYSMPSASELFKEMTPVELIGRILSHVIEPGDILYNPFAGFGSALMACEQLGGSCYAMENSPKKCDFIIRRWQQFTSDKAYQEKAV